MCICALGIYRTLQSPDKVRIVVTICAWIYLYLVPGFGQDRERAEERAGKGRGKEGETSWWSVAWKLIIYGHVSAVAAVAYKDSSWQLLRVPPVWPSSMQRREGMGEGGSRVTGHAICIMCSL